MRSRRNRKRERARRRGWRRNWEIFLITFSPLSRGWSWGWQLDSRYYGSHCRYRFRSA